jgi:hypothetical protein
MLENLTITWHCLGAKGMLSFLVYETCRLRRQQSAAAVLVLLLLVLPLLQELMAAFQGSATRSMIPSCSWCCNGS